MASAAVSTKVLILLLFIHCLLLPPLFVGVLCLVIVMFCSALFNFLFCNHLAGEEISGPEVLKLVSCSTQLSTKF